LRYTALNVLVLSLLSLVLHSQQQSPPPAATALPCIDIDAGSLGIHQVITVCPPL
jgi:hypothetical protein